jgi:hypothetical protein
MPMTSDLLGMAAAYTDAPDDEAPRGILRDLLEGDTEYAVRYANYCLYWDEIIPKFEQLLHPGKAYRYHWEQLRPDRHNQTYTHRVAYAGMPKWSRKWWALAVLRVICDQGGDKLWDMLSLPHKQTVADLELYTLDIATKPEPRDLTKPGKNVWDNKGVGIRPLRGHMGDRCVEYLPIFNGWSVEEFLLAIRGWLVAWEELMVAANGEYATELYTKYSFDFLFMNWIRKTMQYAHTKHNSHLRNLRELMS